MLHFTEDCILGIEVLDNEHRHLFELMERVDYLLKSVYLADRYTMIKEVLEQLENYAELHFEHEEAYMKEKCDPELIQQRAQHDFFREKVQQMLVHNISEDEQQQEVLQELLEFLAKWLYHHIIGSDIMIGKLPPLEEWMIRDNPCEFSDEFLVGIELIDAEHRELFRIIDKAYRLVKAQVTTENLDEVMQILGELKNYTKEHFSDEEEYMESIHYDGLEAQKRAHAAFISRLDDVTPEKLDKNPQKYMESLIEFLLGWLIYHIMQTDKKIPVK